MTSGTQARADRRGLFSAALIGSGVGLGLGAIYLAAGMAQVVSDQDRAERIAQAARGGLSAAMLQRGMDRMDPAALHLAHAHDGVASGPGRDALGRDAFGRNSAQGWPSQLAERRPAGGGGSALDGARELDCLTQAVYFEARGETPRGQAAVAQVVMNRVASPSFPKSVCGVVFQGAATHGCQFSFACDGSMRHGREAGAWDRARRIAERALSGVVLSDVGKATHFHTTAVQPEWGPQMLRVAQVGLHVFYRFNPHAPAGQPENRAVFVNLPMGPASNLSLATAVLEKTAKSTVAASGLAPASTEAKPSPPKLPEPPTTLSRVSEPSDGSRSADAAAS